MERERERERDNERECVCERVREESLLVYEKGGRDGNEILN